MAEGASRPSLEDTYGTLIDAIDLGERERQFMRLRWLDQLAWTERAAGRANRWYHLLRATAVVGAVIVPALVGAQFNDDLQPYAVGAALAISLVVAICAGVEGFFRFGERWRHYRESAEQLKSEGWSFLQLAGPYRRFNPDHASAYPTFAGRVEALIQREVEIYISEVAREREDRQAAEKADEGKRIA
jgi:Protein of unknown function (DUF4231)